ncbi:MAG: hypothetical protein KAI17_24210 [Thiotrichaceae bacterium]|nr:hypothetical protein [Thiotrichaceae bacterium]
MLRKSVGSLMLLASVYASAGENYFQNSWDAKGLLALEGGFGIGSVKQTQNDPATGALFVLNSTNEAAISGGFKLGGESEHYRLFLSARYHEVQDFDSVVTAGAELQYLIRAGENFNIFLGVNGGMMASQKTIGALEYSTDNAYAGVDAGVNIDITENFGLELGARLNNTFDDSDNPANIAYLAEGYASLVFKFTGDY